MDRVSTKTKSASVASIKSKVNSCIYNMHQTSPKEYSSPVNHYGKKMAPQTYNFLNENDIIKIVASKIDIVLPTQSTKVLGTLDQKPKNDCASCTSQTRVKTALSPRSVQVSMRSLRRFGDSKSIYSNLTAASQASMISGISYNLKKPAEYNSKLSLCVKIWSALTKLIRT